MAAAVSVVILFGAVVWKTTTMMKAGVAANSYVAADVALVPEATPDAQWQQEMILLGLATSTSPAATSSNDTVAMIGPMVAAQLAGQYAGIQDSGAYSTDALESAAQKVASNLKASVTYRTYTTADIKTDPDTSVARMLTYRSDLRAALAPLVENTTPELELFARYVETNDPEYLTELQHAAANYRIAIAATASLTVPRDAVNYHRGILNAMGEFASTIDSLSIHGADALASAALLRTFNAAEQNMYMSFNSLASYYTQKKS